jgi:hypothetical protein
LRDLFKLYDRQYRFHWRYFDIQSMLGAALVGQKKTDTEAEQLLRKGYEGLKERQAQLPPERQYYLTEAVERLVQFYDARGRPDEAARWRTKLEEARKLAGPPKVK